MCDSRAQVDDSVGALRLTSFEALHELPSPLLKWRHELHLPAAPVSDGNIPVHAENVNAPGGSEQRRPYLLAFTVQLLCLVLEEHRGDLDAGGASVRFALLHRLVDCGGSRRVDRERVRACEMIPISQAGASMPGIEDRPMRRKGPYCSWRRSRIW